MDDADGGRSTSRYGSPPRTGAASSLEGEAYYLQGTQKARVTWGYGDAPEPMLSTHRSQRAAAFDAGGESVQGTRTLLTMVKPAYRPGKIARLNRVVEALETQGVLPASMVGDIEPPEYAIDESTLRAYSLPPMPPEDYQEYARAREPGVVAAGASLEISFYEHDHQAAAAADARGGSPRRLRPPMPDADAEERAQEGAGRSAAHDAAGGGVPSTSAASSPRRARGSAEARLSSELKTGVETVWFFIKQNEIRARQRDLRREVSPSGGADDEDAQEARPAGERRGRGGDAAVGDGDDDDGSGSDAGGDVEDADDGGASDGDEYDVAGRPAHRLSSRDFLENTPIVICKLASASRATVPASLNDAVTSSTHPLSMFNTGYVYDPYDLVVVKEPPKTEPYYVVRDPHPWLARTRAGARAGSIG